MLNIVENDLFGIVSRLKSIDESYFVVFNQRLKRFEVHSKAQRGDSLAVALPFERLDHRAIFHVYRTRAERAMELMELIERENERLERESMKSSINKACDEIFG